jgi:hypothetical protein
MWLVSLTSLLLPTAARIDTRKAALLALHQQCRSVAASQGQSADESIAQYPMTSIVRSVIASIQSAARVLPSAARVLRCCSLMQHHPDHHHTVSRLTDPSLSFSSSIAIQSLRHFVLNQGREPEQTGGGGGGGGGEEEEEEEEVAGPCPHADEDLIEYDNMQHAVSAAADIVALLLLRVNRSGDMGIISSRDHSEVFMSSQLLLDLVPLLPAATSDIISLLSAACVTAAAAPSLWHNSTPPPPPALCFCNNLNRYQPSQRFCSGRLFAHDGAFAIGAGGAAVAHTDLRKQCHASVFHCPGLLPFSRRLCSCSGD